MALETSHFSKEQQIACLVKQVAAAIQGIRFGSVEIIIHDSRIVQVERTEKLRFDSHSSR